MQIVPKGLMAIGAIIVLGKRRPETFLLKHLYYNRNASQILQVIKDNVKQMLSPLEV
jgi:hypothetical protein